MSVDERGNGGGGGGERCQFKHSEKKQLYTQNEKRKKRIKKKKNWIMISPHLLKSFHVLNQRNINILLNIPIIFKIFSFVLQV